MKRPPVAAALLCAGLLACAYGPAHAYARVDAPAPASAPAAASFTSRASLDDLFELEGDPPFAAPYDGTLTFSALASRFATANGHGWRNELKIAPRHRRTVEQTREHFSAIVTPALPPGAKTIVAQYHVEGLDTILKVYVQDTGDAHAFDGKGGNGVFDVVARILGAAGKETATALATVRSGESFALDIRLENGVALVSADSAAHGLVRTAPTRIPGDGRKVYFKFGDYAQALDPATGKPTSDPARWRAWFREHHIDAGTLRFGRVVFERD
jgi:hypothetical protein